MNEFEFRYNEFSHLSYEVQFQQWVEMMQTPIVFEFKGVDGKLFNEISLCTMKSDFIMMNSFSIGSGRSVDSGIKVDFTIHVKRCKEGKLEIEAFYKKFFPQFYCNGTIGDTLHLIGEHKFEQRGGIKEVMYFPRAHFEWEATLTIKDAPLSVYSVTELRDLLQKKIEEEDYEAAAVIRDELNRRKK